MKATTLAMGLIATVAFVALVLSGNALYGLKFVFFISGATLFFVLAIAGWEWGWGE